jgi:3-oxoacyl-[acyl-carrier protein] reductase
VSAAAGMGIGRAVAKAFLAEGAVVGISDVNEKRVQRTAEELGELGEVTGHLVDVRDPEQVHDWIQDVKQRHGRIDIGFNNAGLNDPAPIHEMSRETWDWIVGVNLTGTFQFTRELAPVMMEQGAGVIINVSSYYGWHGAAPGEAAYSAAKAGVMGFTRATAAELAPHGVRVCAIAPGVIYNEFLERVYPEVRKRVDEVPLGRLGTPEDVARAAVFLASDEASYITGEVLGVTGGLYMHP